MNDMTIGQFLSSLRKSKGYTQQNVADALNVSNKTISGWERDVAMPDANFIPLLAELYGVSCDELLKGRRESPVPYGLRSDEVSSRLFVSTYGAQKTANAIVCTVIACLFLAGGYMTAIILSLSARSDPGLYYSLSLPFTAVSLAITLTAYLTSDQSLKLNGKDFVGLRRKLLDVCRGALLAEVASPILLLPVLFGSDKALTTSLLIIGSAFLTAIVLFLVDGIIRYCNKDLFPRTRRLKAFLTASAVVTAAAVCVLAVCLPLIYVQNRSSVDILKTQSEFSDYGAMVRALEYDPLAEHAESKVNIQTSDNGADCIYTFAKDADISEILRAYPEYDLYRLPDRLELRITYNLLTVTRKTVIGGVEASLSSRIVLTAPGNLCVSYAEQQDDGTFLVVSPVDADAARQRIREVNDLAAAVTICAVGLILLAVLLITTGICKKKIRD